MEDAILKNRFTILNFLKSKICIPDLDSVAQKNAPENKYMSERYKPQNYLIIYRAIQSFNRMFYTWENPSGSRRLVWEDNNKKEIEDDLRKVRTLVWCKADNRKNNCKAI